MSPERSDVELEPYCLGLFRLSDGSETVVLGNSERGRFLFTDVRSGTVASERDVILFTPSDGVMVPKVTYFIMSHGIEGIRFKRSTPELVDVIEPKGFTL